MTNIEYMKLKNELVFRVTAEELYNANSKD